VTSTDFGATWSAPRLLDPFLGRYKGVYPGPGNGLVLSAKSKNPGRYLFAAWGVNSGRAWADEPHHDSAAGGNHYDVVAFSDDGGNTYSVSKTTFPANLTGNFEEPTIAETQSGDVRWLARPLLVDEQTAVLA
jgi:hypothetical protein